GLSDPVTTRRAFANAFGAQLEDAIEAWRTYSAATSKLLVPIDMVDCGAPMSPVAADRWRVDDVVPDGCQSGVTPQGTSYSQPTGRYGFEVTRPGLYVVEMAAERGDEKGTLRSCVLETSYDYRASKTTRRFMLVPLVGGRHAIDVARGTRSWSVTRLGAA